MSLSKALYLEYVRYEHHVMKIWSLFDEQIRESHEKQCLLCINCFMYVHVHFWSRKCVNVCLQRWNTLRKSRNFYPVWNSFFWSATPCALPPPRPSIFSIILFLSATLFTGQWPLSVTCQPTSKKTRGILSLRIKLLKFGTYPPMREHRWCMYMKTKNRKYLLKIFK
jgi:hypothetical protein